MIWLRVAYPAAARGPAAAAVPGWCWCRSRWPSWCSPRSSRWRSHERGPGGSRRDRAGPRARRHAADDDAPGRDPAVPRRRAGPAAAQPRGDRAVRGELHGLHAVRPGVPGLVHLHRLAQGDGGGRRARPGPGSATCWTGSRSTSRCACTAGSASRSCPFDALFWSPEFEYAEYDIRDLTHEQDRLREWMWTVPPPPAHDPDGRAGEGGRRGGEGRAGRAGGAGRGDGRRTARERP